MTKELKYNLGPAYYEDGASRTNLNGWLSKSMLWQFNQSPYAWLFGPPFKPTDAMTYGTVVHTLLYQPDEVGDFFAVCPFDDFRKKEAREWKSDALASGKEVIKQSEVERAQQLADTISESTQYQSIGLYESEVSCYTSIMEQPVRGMIDMVPSWGNALADLKTTAIIGSVKDLQSKIINLGYHMQAALYLDIYNDITGDDRDEFKFLFVETGGAHEMALVTIKDDWLVAGRDAYMNAIAKWIECKATGCFPMQHKDEIILEMPKWARYTES